MSIEKENKKGTGCFSKAVLGGLTFLVITLVLFYFLVWHVPDKSAEIDRIVKEINQREDALDLQPQSENGWLQYKKACEILGFKEFKGITKYGQIAPPPDDRFVTNKIRIEFIRKVVKSNRKSIELVDEGSRKKFAYPYPHRDLSSKGRLSTDKAFSDLSILLILEGEYEKNRGNTGTAVKRYLQALNIVMSSSFRHYYAVYNNSAIYDCIFYRLSFLLKENPADRELLKSVYNSLSKMENVVRGYDIKYEEFFFDVKFQRKMITRYIRIEIKSKYLRGKLKSVSSFIPVNLLADREFLIAQNIFCRYRGKNPNRVKERKIKVSLMDFHNELRDEFVDKYNEFCFIETRIQGIKLLAALQLYYCDNKEYPETLSQLVPKYIDKVPMDPFNQEETFRYRKIKPGEILLYSIGGDFKDDNGKTEAKDEDSKGDILFRLKRDNK